MEIPKDLKDEVWEYCRLNDITDLNAFIIRMLRQGYSTEKYGPTPFKIGGNSEKEVIVEKRVEVPVEVIKEVEKIVEVPIEVIKEVEKIVEVPIEVIREIIKEIPVEIIKEVPVDKIIEKEVYITDDEQVTELTKRIQELESTPPRVIEIEKEIIVEKEVPFEVIKEVIIEKIIEVDDPGKVRKLEQEIENLKIELELEKNRRLEKKKIEQPKEDNGQKNILSNVINWVSKSEREKKDLYDE
jgi:hypothetical protein